MAKMLLYPIFKHQQHNLHMKHFCAPYLPSMYGTYLHVVTAREVFEMMIMPLHLFSFAQFQDILLLSKYELMENRENWIIVMREHNENFIHHRHRWENQMKLGICIVIHCMCIRKRSTRSFMLKKQNYVRNIIYQVESVEGIMSASLKRSSSMNHCNTE